MARLIAALSLFVFWAWLTFFSYLLLAAFLAGKGWRDGIPQFILLLVVVFTSMLSYAYTTDRLLWPRKKKATGEGS